MIAVLAPRLSTAAGMLVRRFTCLVSSWGAGFSLRRALARLRDCGTEVPRGLKPAPQACFLTSPELSRDFAAILADAREDAV